MKRKLMKRRDDLLKLAGEFLVLEYQASMLKTTDRREAVRLDKIDNTACHFAHECAELAEKLGDGE